MEETQTKIFEALKNPEECSIPSIRGILEREPLYKLLSESQIKDIIDGVLEMCKNSPKTKLRSCIREYILHGNELPKDMETTFNNKLVELVKDCNDLKVYYDYQIKQRSRRTTVKLSFKPRVDDSDDEDDDVINISNNTGIVHSMINNQIGGGVTTQTVQSVKYSRSDSDRHNYYNW